MSHINKPRQGEIMTTYEEIKHQDPAAFRVDWQQWIDKQNENLLEPYGWLSLTGMVWLTEGAVTTVNGFPGTWEQHGNKVTYTPDPDHVAVNRGQRISEPTVFDVSVDGDVSAENIDADGIRAELTKVIGGRTLFAVRIRNPKSINRAKFTGIPYFEPDQRWVAPARYVASSLQEITVDADNRNYSLENKLGTLYVTFDGIEYPLTVIQAHDDTTGRLKITETGNIEYRVRRDSDELALVQFRDSTNGNQTYGAGRRLIVKRADLSTLDYADFNRASTAPCAFNSYCTCPFPPAENVLPFPVTAGTRKPVDHEQE